MTPIIHTSRGIEFPGKNLHFQPSQSRFLEMLNIVYIFQKWKYQTKAK